MAPALGGKGGDGCAVVSAEDGQKRRGRRFRQPVGQVRPAGLDVGPRVEVGHGVNPEPGQGARILGDGRHGRGELANSSRRQRSALTVDGRAVIGNAGDHDVGSVDWIAGQAAPGLESGEVHLGHALRISGTFRMSRPPTNSQTKNTVNMTGYPPSRPSSLGPLLNSSRKPPTKRAMTPEPAVAILLKPMNRPASPGGMMS